MHAGKTSRLKRPKRRDTIEFMKRRLPQQVRRKLDELPAKPGCYLMWDEHANVLYVGKALVLRHRARSYFQQSAKHSSRIHEMVGKARDITWWVTATEMEALILENDLIKRHQPHYNVMLKDDKGYPYIKVNWQDDFPKVERVRQIKDDGARYFGPFTSSWAVSRTLESMRKVFPYLDCDRNISGNDESPCLYYHLKLCGGPCIGAQSRTEYREGICQLIDFLEGDTDAVMNQLETRMHKAAERFNFELAAVYRDRIKAAQRIVHQQKVVGVQNDDEDVVAIAQDAKSSDTVVQILMVRRGRLVGRENFALQGVELSETTAENLGDLIGIFIQRFYTDAAHVPPRLLVQFVPRTRDLLAAWLSKRRGAKVEIRMPQRGKKRKLMEFAKSNAEEYLRVQKAQWAEDTNRQTEALAELQDALALQVAPTRIECYDISTLQGTNTVGSMVVFARGAPLKSAYKRFKIRGKGAHGEPDDYASMREVLRRRFRRAVENDAERPGRKPAGANHWKLLPDLVIVDGGKGQLGVANEVLEEFGLPDRVPVVALAKREEEIFLPQRRNPVLLRRGSQAFYMVQRIRDEAHRFAVTYHRSLRRKGQTNTVLDTLPGIGPRRRRALLQFFNGDLDKMRQATLDELRTVPGMNRKAAQSVKEHL